MSVFFSGIQPSGESLHLGNYIGAILNWKKIVQNMSSDDKCYFMIADLHAMTSNHDADAVRENIKKLIATYIACGIEPSDKIIFFQQSKISAHCELCWILTTITQLGQLERMTQFKEKKTKLDADKINAGLLCYPILMAADIILYGSNYIPVGEDQTQHLEFTRDIVQKFINIYGNGSDNDIFVMPELLIDKTSKRIMSLGDGLKKMSKSAGEDKDRIFLLDTDDQIAKKIRTAKTDSLIGIYYDKEKRPEVSNLINIFSALSERSVDDVSNEYNEKNTKTFKDDLTQLLISKIAPIREKQKELLENETILNNILTEGTEIANEKATDTLIKVKKTVGLL